MRNVIYAINVTADGCCDHRKMSGDKEALAYFTGLLGEVDLQIFGRKTYELMVPYWPEVANNPSETEAEREFARAFVSLRKVVFSRSLDSVEDGNTRIVGTDLQDEIIRLKQQPGKSILVGGVDIPTQLMNLDLIDEYRFFVLPAIAGEGRRLFDDVSLPKTQRLELVETQVFKSGRVLLRYRKP
jgi:dihydrofolate reductase